MSSSVLVENSQETRAPFSVEAALHHVITPSCGLLRRVWWGGERSGVHDNDGTVRLLDKARPSKNVNHLQSPVLCKTQGVLIRLSGGKNNSKSKRNKIMYAKRIYFRISHTRKKNSTRFPMINSPAEQLQQNTRTFIIFSPSNIVFNLMISV